jgi:lipoprotein-anchoring transpeptidase ErfK/SrfK
MGFDTDPHYGIHGTLHPEAIGQQVTDGCVRLKNEDVEELFDIIPVGTQVVIQN